MKESSKNRPALGAAPWLLLFKMLREFWPTGEEQADDRQAKALLWKASSGQEAGGEQTPEQRTLAQARWITQQCLLCRCSDGCGISPSPGAGSQGIKELRN